MKCLVTGATGFVGSHLVERLVKKGHTVRALVRPASSIQRLSGLRLEKVEGDLLDEKSLVRAVTGMENIFHCAAKVSDWGKRAEFFEANVEGTKNILAAAIQEKVKRFVYVSSCEVYGNPGKEDVSENSPLVYGQHPYTDSKIEAEELVWDYYFDGLPAVILRPSTIYGPRSYNILAEIADLIRHNKLILVNQGRAKARLCYVENLVDALILSAEHEKAVGQVFNVTDGCATTWKQVYDRIAQIIGARKPDFSMPYPLAFLVASGMEYAGKVLGMRRRPMATRMACRMTGIDQSFSIAKLQERLGYLPVVTFDEGMDRLASWLTDENTAQIDLRSIWRQ